MNMDVCAATCGVVAGRAEVILNVAAAEDAAWVDVLEAD